MRHDHWIVQFQRNIHRCIKFHDFARPLVPKDPCMVRIKEDDIVSLSSDLIDQTGVCVIAAFHKSLLQVPAYSTETHDYYSFLGIVSFSRVSF